VSEGIPDMQAGAIFDTTPAKKIQTARRTVSAAAAPLLLPARWTIRSKAYVNDETPKHCRYWSRCRCRQYARRNELRWRKGKTTARTRKSISRWRNRTIAADGVRNYSEGVKGVVEVKLTTDKAKFVWSHEGGRHDLLLIKGGRDARTWSSTCMRAPWNRCMHEVEDLLGEPTASG